MIKKNIQEPFSRITPQITQFREKPLTQWASGKIKRLYDGYSSFCSEIEKLLGEPQSRPHISNEQSAEMLDEFDFLWQAHENPLENATQLLTLLSSFYKAGFVMRREEKKYFVKSYFADETYASFIPLLESSSGPLAAESENLKPQCVILRHLIDDAHPDDLAFHFWLYPEESVGIILISDAADSQRREVVYKTQALIQRRFYD